MPDEVLPAQRRGCSGQTLHSSIHAVSEQLFQQMYLSLYFK